MNETAIAAILSGSNDEEDLYKLYRSIAQPENRFQEKFLKCWQVSMFLAADGLEWLFEQSWTLDDFKSLFIDIGFTQANPIIEKLQEIVPDNLRRPECEEEMLDQIEKNFDQLNELFDEYLEIADEHLMTALAQFVRDHKKDFQPS